MKSLNSNTVWPITMKIDMSTQFYQDEIFILTLNAIGSVIVELLQEVGKVCQASLYYLSF